MIAETIARALGSRLASHHPAGGGCIHQAMRIGLMDGRFVFVKPGQGHAAALLAAEEAGLRLLSPRIATPAILGSGTDVEGTGWLALEWLDMRPVANRSLEQLGRMLACLHGNAQPRFGLDCDNFIGATLQKNTWHDDWLSFFVECRLMTQITLAREAGHAIPESAILHAAETLLRDHQPTASLVHGDLWSGNVAELEDGKLIVFDPAPYWGDPETDLAMLELFGPTLGMAFFTGYGGEPHGRERRRPLYDLYHALNHLNLFGEGYAGMVRRCIEALPR